MYLSIRNCLFLSFGVVLMLFTLTFVYINYETKKLQHIEKRLLENSLPTVNAGEKLLSGIEQSLASLRGYMILGADPENAEKFSAERQEAWAKIDNTMFEYERLAADWNNQEDLQRLDEMKVLIEEFRNSQQEIEDISHAPENTPSIHLLFSEATPKSIRVNRELTKIINAEFNLEANRARKQLFKVLADSRGAFLGALANIRAYLLSGDEKYKRFFRKQWDNNNVMVRNLDDQAYLFDSEQKKSWDRYKKYYAEFSNLPEQMFTLRSQPDWNKANYWLGTKAAPRANQIKVILNELAESKKQIAKQEAELLSSKKVDLQRISTLVAVISVIFGIIVAFTLSQSLASQLSSMANNAMRISEGDLTVALLPKGRIKEFNTLTAALNTTKTNLSALCSRIMHSTIGLASQSENLESTISQSQQVINRQEQNTLSIENAIKEMVASVKNVKNSTQEAASSAAEADHSTSRGNRVVIETVENINELAIVIENAANTIDQLSEQANEMDTILVSISSIADQTNLLALNAAIEAARAGDQGRGFSVVADEVRTLAASTQESTIEIRTMLERLKTGAKDAVDEMSAGHKQAQGCVATANGAKEILQEIVGAMSRINDMNTHIATAVEQQSTVMNEMGLRITTVGKGAQEIVEKSEESLSSSREMAVLTKAVSQDVSVFKVDDSHS